MREWRPAGPGLLLLVFGLQAILLAMRSVSEDRGIWLVAGGVITALGIVLFTSWKGSSRANEEYNRTTYRASRKSGSARVRLRILKRIDQLALPAGARLSLQRAEPRRKDT